MCFERLNNDQSGGRKYTLKTSAYSSHSLLLRCFPDLGDGLRVLDLGCGEGYLSLALAQRGFDVVAVDALERPNSTPLPNIKRITWDLDQGVPDLSAKYDFVLCADVLEHLKDPQALLIQVREVLSSRGQVVASLPNSGHLYFRMNVLLGRFPAHDRGLFDRTHLHFFTWKGWCRLFESSGLRVLRVLPTAVPVGLAFPRWDGTAMARVLERLSYESARLWKKLFAYQFVVTAQPVDRYRGSPRSPLGTLPS